MTFVFDILKCDIDAIQGVSPDAWLPDPNIPDWPEDIRACVPLPPPTLDTDWPSSMGCPTFPIGEPVFTPGTDFETKLPLPVPIFVPPAQAGFWWEFSADGDCGFDFNLGVDFPCPVFPSGRVTFETGTGIVGGYIDFMSDEACGFQMQGEFWGGGFPVHFHQAQIEEPYYQWTPASPQVGPPTLDIYYPKVELTVVTGWQVSGTEIQVKHAKVHLYYMEDLGWQTAHIGIQCQEAGFNTGYG